MRWLVVAILASTPVLAFGQTAPAPGPETLGFTVDEAFLRDLPLSDSAYTLLETVQPSIISDRFTAGGLFTGESMRVGGFQSSWTQTRFLIGDVEVSDPTGSGASLLFPELGPWERIRVATGLIANDVNTTGLVLELGPHAPSTTWEHTVTGTASGGSLAGHASTLAEPTIARLKSRGRGSWTSTGPLSERIGASFALSWTEGSQFERNSAVASDERFGSAVASVVYTAGSGGSLHTLGAVQRMEQDLEGRLFLDPTPQGNDETHVHIQSTWRSPTNRAWPWRVFGAYTQRTDSRDRLPILSIERLVDGPVSAFVPSSRGTVRQWTVGGRASSTRMLGDATHHLTGGADVVGAQHSSQPSDVQATNEVTDGLLSRVWVFNHPSRNSERHSLSFNLHVNDSFQLTPRLAVSGGLRFESVSGSAEGAVEGIGWLTLLPRARLDWRLREGGRTTAFIGYTRSAYRLSLDALAFGDPAAPTADVYRWDPRILSSALPLGTADTPLVARVGPGVGVSGDLTRIDSALGRPVVDELAFGFEMNPSPRARFQLAAVGRRESGFFGLINTGAPASAYRVTGVEDPGANTGDPADDKVIPVFDRIPSTFGADRYLLTNTDQDAALSGSLELSGQYATSRLTFYGGATASIAQGSAASRGYGPLENDQSALSDSYVTPNGDTFARGRLFNDRAFTIKFSGVYRFPWDVRLGAIARYQDGQPFSRMLVFPELAQGAEAVRAFPAGDSRFRFIGTLDTRLTKGFALGSDHLDFILDVYNLPGLTYDVEERAAAAPNDRTPIAIQPSRIFHLGARVTF